MRPALKSGLLPVWRDRDTLQFGVDPRRAVALTGMGRLSWLLELLDGSRDREQVIAAASECGVAADLAGRLLDLLMDAGALDDFPSATIRAIPPALRSSLTAELATAALAAPASDGGASMLARRRAARVRIRGTAPVGQSIARILTAAGIGSVTGPAGPGGSGGTRLGPALVILTEPQPPEVIAGLVADRVAHLAITAAEAIGVVGPLVLPGKTACLRCLDFTRTDIDPAWPLILAQLAGRRPPSPACDAALTAAVAAQAAAQALGLIDRARQPHPAINGTLELVAPGWQWRRRSWLPHRACTCGSHPLA